MIIVKNILHHQSPSQNMQEHISEQTLLGVSSACTPGMEFDGVIGFWSLSCCLAIVVMMCVVSGVRSGMRRYADGFTGLTKRRERDGPRTAR